MGIPVKNNPVFGIADIPEKSPLFRKRFTVFPKGHPEEERLGSAEHIGGPLHRPVSGKMTGCHIVKLDKIGFIHG
jgi:hypothetical protein